MRARKWLIGTVGLAVLGGAGIGAWGVVSGASPGSGASVLVRGPAAAQLAVYSGTGSSGALPADLNGPQASCTGPAALLSGWTAQSAVSNVLGSLQTLSGFDKDTAKHVAEAITDLQKIDSTLWVDGNHVDPNHGDQIFEGVKKAAKDLSDIKVPQPAWVLTEINYLDSAMRLVATTAISDSSVTGKVNEIQAAQKELAAGDCEYAKPHYDAAIDHYRNAWQHAGNALGPNAFPITGTLSGLYPGATRPLVLTVLNPNNFDILVTSLSVIPGAAPSGCNASTYLRTGSFSGPLAVRHNASAQTIVQVTMLQSAPDPCQGAVFPLTYSAQAVKS